MKVTEENQIEIIEISDDDDDENVEPIYEKVKTELRARIDNGVIELATGANIDVKSRPLRDDNDIGLNVMNVEDNENKYGEHDLIELHPSIGGSGNGNDSLLSDDDNNASRHGGNEIVCVDDDSDDESDVIWLHPTPIPVMEISDSEDDNEGKRFSVFKNENDGRGNKSGVSKLSPVYGVGDDSDDDDALIHVYSSDVKPINIDESIRSQLTNASHASDFGTVNTSAPSYTRANNLIVLSNGDNGGAGAANLGRSADSGINCELNQENEINQVDNRQDIEGRLIVESNGNNQHSVEYHPIAKRSNAAPKNRRRSAGKPQRKRRDVVRRMHRYSMKMR